MWAPLRFVVMAIIRPIKPRIGALAPTEIVTRDGAGQKSAIPHTVYRNKNRAEP